MCITGLETIGLAGLLQGAGAVAGVVGTLASASAQSAAAQSAADQNERNAIIAQRNAEDSRQRGVAQEQEQQLRTRARVGMQKNVLSERNIALNTGSALDILGDTAMFGKLDALTTRGNFEREAISYEGQQMNFNAQAEMDRMEARNAMTAGGISAFSTALGSAGSIAQNSQRRRMSL